MKKEIRVILNLNNDNEKELFEYLETKTSASGTMKDICIDFIKGNSFNNNTNSNSSDEFKDIVKAINNLSECISNLEVVGVGSPAGPIEKEVKTLDFSNIDKVEDQFDDDDY